MSGSYSSVIQNAAYTYGVDPGVLSALAASESSYNPNQITAEPNGTTSYGLFQLNSNTISNPGYGIAPITQQQALNPQTNADFAAQYLAALLQNNGGNYSTAVANYNGATSLSSSSYASQSNYPNLVSAINAANAETGVTTTGKATLGSTAIGSAQASAIDALSGSSGADANQSADTNAAAAGTSNCPLGTVFGVSLCVVALVILGIVLIGAGVFMLGKEAL
jgi:hypothetical protein